MPCVPELHDPVRGRIKGRRAFEVYVAETNAWLQQSNASIDDVERVVTETGGFEEVVVHLDGERGRVDLPVALGADDRADGLLDEVRPALLVRGQSGELTAARIYDDVDPPLGQRLAGARVSGGMTLQVAHERLEQ
jgi:hypothetical protein